MSTFSLAFRATYLMAVCSAYKGSPTTNVSTHSTAHITAITSIKSANCPTYIRTIVPDICANGVYVPTDLSPHCIPYIFARRTNFDQQ
jgi:hypothetical protein